MIGNVIRACEALVELLTDDSNPYALLHMQDGPSQSDSTHVLGDALCSRFGGVYMDV